MKTANRTKRPRLGSLGDQLGAIREYLFRTEADGPTTNWSITPEDDTPPMLSDFSEDPDLEILPSLPELERAVSSVECRPRKSGAILTGSATPDRRHVEGVPVSGDFETDEKGRVVRLGSLHFANGDADPEIADFEVVDIKGEGARGISTRVRARAGTILGQRVRARLRESVSAGVSNGRVADFINLRHPKRPAVASPECRRLTRNRTMIDALPKAEARALLKLHGVDGQVLFDEARHNAGLDHVMRDSRPVLPAGSSSVGNIFLAMDLTASKGKDADPWSMFVAKRDAEEWRAAHVKLTDRDKAVLEAIDTAKTLTNIGEALGHRGSYAKREGRKALIAANDNLAAALAEAA